LIIQPSETTIKIVGHQGILALIIPKEFNNQNIPIARTIVAKVGNLHLEYVPQQSHHSHTIGWSLGIFLVFFINIIPYFNMIIINYKKLSTQNYLNECFFFKKMNYALIIGWAASITSTISFLPQLIQTVKTKQTKDLSLPMYVMFLFAIILWTIYGISLNSWPMIGTNIVIFTLASIILGYKIKYG